MKLSKKLKRKTPRKEPKHFARILRIHVYQAIAKAKLAQAIYDRKRCENQKKYCLSVALSVSFIIVESIKKDTIIAQVIIYMKKYSILIGSVQFKCNTSAKSVTPVQKV